MKQHLTVEQMQQIDSKTLAELLNDDKFTRGLETLCFLTSDDDDREQLLYEMSCVMTIGKLIELLDEKKPHIYPELIWDGNQYRYTDKWVVEIDSMTKNKPMDFTQNELTDALFEALCYVLEGEE